MNMKNLHLICNAHIDPVWLWDQEEGISAALSTFRMAADFCEEYQGLVFNHNEVLLYEWIEEMEPELFARIQKLVKEGKWHIMGGWYLQPDCNMPSGESFIRQMETGREYFQEKFGVTPSTAINFDPFGHTRGLVQLLAKAGFDSYLFCRPGQGDCPLPSDDFVWVGFDGSKVMAHRADGYGSLMGEAGDKIRGWMEKEGSNKSLPIGCVLWGVGNHGGGPSRQDLKAISQLMEEDQTQWKLLHSSPEAYFEERRRLNEEQGISEPEVEKDLNPWAVGCYTSQIRIKQKHRELEVTLSMAEKMLSQAAIGGLVNYPEEELKKAEKALMFSEFHDILPGSCIQDVGEKALQTLSYGLEIAGKWKTRAFFALMAGEVKAEEGEYPVLIYNPHPFEVEGVFISEFQLANQNWTEETAVPVITQEGRELPCQLEKERCNLNLDWRKQIAFYGKLKPMSMNRFSVKVHLEKEKPKRQSVYSRQDETGIYFDNGKLQVVIGQKSGLMDRYCVDGTEYLREGACALKVLNTDCDPWGMNRKSYCEEIGRFTLMEEQEGSWYSGTLNPRHMGEAAVIPCVRIIEDGPVRTVVEAVLSYGHSQALVQYILPAKGTSVEVKVRVNWAEKGAMLKLEIPTAFSDGIARTETACGVNVHEMDGLEKVMQRWCGIWSQDEKQAFTVINKGNYGVNFQDGAMGISMIHSAVYSAHPIGERPLLVQDRYLPYIDQGETEFTFLLQGEEGDCRQEKVSRDAVLFQENPMIVQAFPSGEGTAVAPALMVDNRAVVLMAFRKKAGEKYFLVRLFESSGSPAEALVTLPQSGICQKICFNPFEVKTFRYTPGAEKLEECSLLG